MSRDFDWPSFLPAFREAAQRAGFSETVLTATPDGELCGWTREAATAEAPTVYLSAGIHGDEPAGPLALLELLRDGFFQPNTGWRLCPALNPGGLATGSRETRQGTDLNRDYLQRTSPEVRAHAAWLAAMPAPELFLSLHEDWEMEGFYLYEINLGDDCPGNARAILEAVRPTFAPEAERVIDGHRTREPGWIHHRAEPDLPEGWPEAIFIAKHGCPLSFTFETPSRHPLKRRIAAHKAAVAAACRT